MKNKLHALLTLSLLATLVMSGCSKEDNSGTTTDETPTTTAGGEPTTSNDEKTFFDVTFKNYDELDLYVAHVEQGQNAVYEGEVPTKPSNVMYDYTFNGWDRDLNNVQESFTTYAQYTESLRKYTITFKNYDGEVLQNTKEEYGTLPTYNGPTPTRASDAVAQYTFAGWDKPIEQVQGDAVYTAKYDSSYAPTYRTTGLVYQIQGNNEYYSVIAYFGSEKNVAIPQYFDGLPVKGIKAGAFSNHDKLESIFIPKTIEFIEPHAFDNCGAINHLTVGEGNSVYRTDSNGDLCSNDTLVYTLPSHTGSFEVDDAYSRVLEGAFSCSKINTLSICAASFSTLPELFSVDAAHMPAELKSIVVKGGDINEEQFMDCTYIESISLLPLAKYLPVTKVGHRAFKNCTALKSLVFSDEIKYIGDEAFMGCIGMTRLRIGTSANVSLNYIGQDAFSGLPNVELYTDYNGTNVKYLGNPECTQLIAMEAQDLTKDYIYIPENTVAIASEAFAKYAKLKSVTLEGNKLQSIGSNAFANCALLEEIHVHMNDDDNYLANLNIIPYDAFTGCTKLLENKAITDADTGKAFYLTRVNDGDVIGKDILGIDLNSFAKRTETDTFSFTLEEGNRAFTFENKILRDVYDNVLCAIFDNEATGVYCNGKVVYPFAFARQYVSSLAFSENVKAIYFGAFFLTAYDGTRIDLPNSLERLGNGAFQNFVNREVTSAQIRVFSGDKLLRIDKNAFLGNRSVEFFTPFAETEKPEGWDEKYNAVGSGFTFRTVWNYGK